MDIETVLVPVDGSEESIEAVEYGVAIAQRYDAGIHVLYVYGEGVVRGIETGDLETDAIAADSASFMDMVRDLAGDVAVKHSASCGFSLSRLSRHPGSVILDAADDLNADFIVIPREPVTGSSDAVIEKAAGYVIAHASTPVLSV